MDDSFLSYGYGDGQLSNSMLHSAVNCPHKFYVEHVKKLDTQVTAGQLAMGALVHSVIEDIERDQPSSMIDYAVGAINARFEAVYNKELVVLLNQFSILYNEAIKATQEDYKRQKGRFAKAPRSTKIWKQNWRAPLKALAFDTIQPRADKFTNIIAKKPIVHLYLDAIESIKGYIQLRSDHDSVGWEQYYEYKLAPFELLGESCVGTIDLLELRRDDTGKVLDARIWDFKTGTHQYSINDVANSDQHCGYSYGVLQEFGVLPSLVGVWQLMRKEVTQHRINNADIHRWKRRVENTIGFVNLLRAYENSLGFKDVLLHLPVPMGLYHKFGCPCPLLYEPDPDLRCPYGYDYEGKKPFDLEEWTL